MERRPLQVEDPAYGQEVLYPLAAVDDILTKDLSNASSGGRGCKKVSTVDFIQSFVSSFSLPASRGGGGSINMCSDDFIQYLSLASVFPPPLEGEAV